MPPDVKSAVPGSRRYYSTAESRRSLVNKSAEGLRNRLKADDLSLDLISPRKVGERRTAPTAHVGAYLPSSTRDNDRLMDRMVDHINQSIVSWRGGTFCVLAGWYCGCLLIYYMADACLCWVPNWASLSGDICVYKSYIFKSLFVFVCNRPEMPGLSDARTN